MKTRKPMQRNFAIIESHQMPPTQKNTHFEDPEMSIKCVLLQVKRQIEIVLQTA